ADEQVAAESNHRERLGRGKLTDECGEIVAVGGNVEAVGRTAATPARVARKRNVARQRAAQHGERLRLAHDHSPVAFSIAGTCPIDPAPIVITTSPALASDASASGISTTLSTNTGSTLPATRTARARARPSAATIGASPAG